MAEAERLRQSLLADAGRGDLLKTIIDRVELRPNGMRMILSLVPLTPAAAPPNQLRGRVFTRECPLRIKRRGVETWEKSVTVGRALEAGRGAIMRQPAHQPAERPPIVLLK